MKRDSLPASWISLILPSIFLALLCASCTKENSGDPADPKGAAGGAASGAAAGAVAGGAAAAHPAVPKPLELSSPEVWGYAAVPNLDRLLNQVSSAAAIFAPGKVTPELLKAQLGAMLGDPELAQLDATRPILVLILKPSQPGMPPAAAALIPAKADNKYDQALGALGLQAKLADGLVFASQTPEGIGSAEKMKPVYDQIAAARLEKGARLFFHLGGLLEAFGPLIEMQLDNFLSMMPTAAGAAGAPPSAAGTAFINLEARMLLALIKQCETLQLDINLSAQRVEIEKLVTAKPGTALQEWFVKSSPCNSPQSSMADAGTILAGSACVDPKSTQALIQQLLETVSAQPDLARFKDLAGIFDMSGIWDGFMVFNLSPGKDAPFNMAFDMVSTDETKYLAFMEKITAQFSPGKPLGDLYKDMGMEISPKIEKAARQHAGASVHRLKFSPQISGDKLPAHLTPESIKAFMKDTEVVVVKGRGLLSNDAAVLDAMIDRASTAGPRELQLASKKAFGPGRQMYFDYDLVELFKALQQFLPEGPGKAALASLQGAPKDPMLAAMTFGDGRALFQLHFPLGPLARLIPR